MALIAGTFVGIVVPATDAGLEPQHSMWLRSSLCGMGLSRMRLVCRQEISELEFPL